MTNHIFKNLKLTLFWIGVLSLYTSDTYAQKQEYAFSVPGNTCYFQYTFFAPNHDNNYKNKPLIFILGKRGESANDAFESDTLRHQSEFYFYKFIYLPNRTGAANKKLSCLNGLTSLLTNNYSNNRENLFFVIKDTSITIEDITENEIDKLFKRVSLNSKIKITNEPSVTIFEHFKETEVIVESSFDEYGTYYIEEEKKPTVEIKETVRSKKVYYGTPSSYDFTLTGIIRDRTNGETLPYATIMVKGTGIGSTSNEDGYFTILKVPTDTSTLVAQYIGYRKEEIYLTPKTINKGYTIELVPSAATLRELTVIGERQDVVLSDDREVSVIRMTTKKVAQLPSMGEKDVMRSFQLMPGVSASNESSSGLYVRGGTPDQNLVIFDGFTVYHVDHLYGFFSAFNSNALKDVKLHKGGFESKFGGRLSSVTELTGKDGNQKKFNLGADISLLSINIFTEIPIGKKFSSIIAFRRSYKGFLYNKIFNQFNEVEETQQNNPPGPGGRQSQETNVKSYFYDLNGKFTFRPNTKDIISLSFFSGSDKLDNSSSLSVPSFGPSNSNFNNSFTDLTKYGNLGTSLKWSRKWGAKLYGNTILSYSNYFSDRDRSQERTITDSSNNNVTTKTGVFENNDLRDYSFKSDYNWDLFNKAQFQFGGFGTYYDIKYAYAQNDTTTVLDKHDKAILAGAYVQSKVKLFEDKVLFVPGIRASYYQTTNKLYYEPRASVSYRLSKEITLKGAVGLYYQFANRVTREDILSGSKDFWLLSNDESIPVSSATHYIAGISYDKRGYLFSIEGYYKDINNLTEYSLRFNPSPLGVSYEENFFTGSGFSRGLEFLIQKKSGKLNGWLSYSLGEAKNKFDIYSDSYYPANQDVTHEFKAVGMYNYKRWDFSATWIFATGRPYTSPSGAYELTLLDGSTETYFTVTSKNGLRLPNYNRLDISANYKLLAGKKGEKRRREIGYIGFSVFNLYNRTNVWYKQYTIEDSEIIEVNVNYLGFTPNITLSLKIR